MTHELLDGVAQPAVLGRAPSWAVWNAEAAASPWTVGLEEEAMLLDPRDWALAPHIDTVLPGLTDELRGHVGAETHGSALELRTGVHATVPAASGELAGLRRLLHDELLAADLRVACAGMHPFAVWQDTKISGGERYQSLYGSMRELARREPTFALHVHVAIADRENAVIAFNRLRAHLPLLLALSANSPFWQGRDTGLASARTPLFQGFPRVGVPRAFADYAEYVEAIDLLVRCDAFPEPTYLWWDVRLQPRFATIEVRVMDAQTRTVETAGLAALVQSLVKLEIEEGFVSQTLVEAPEVLEENRFLAARDGIDAELIDPVAGRRVPVAELVERTLAACAPHAQDLGCADQLLGLRGLMQLPGSKRQLLHAQGPNKLVGLVQELAADY